MLELHIYCYFRFNFTSLNLVDYCVALQTAIYEALEGLNDTINRDNPNNFNRYVATFGNSDTLKTGDWVPILRQNRRFPQQVTIIYQLDQNEADAV